MRHNSFLTILTVAGSLLWATAGTLQAQGSNDEARNEWMKGYVKMESADKAYERDNKLGALQLYREAQDKFEQVRHRYPNWNQSLLNYRINYCRKKIEDLSGKVAAETETMDRETLLKLTTKQAKQLQELSENITKLKTSLAATEESLERARAEAVRNAAAESDYQSLRQAKADLEDKVRLLNLKLDKLGEDNAALRKQLTDKKTVEKMKDDLRLAEAQVKELGRQLADSREDVRKQKERLGRQEDENERLKRQVAEAEKATQAVRKKLERTEQDVTEAAGELQDKNLKLEQQAVEMRQLRTSLRNAEQARQDDAKELENLRDFRNKFVASQERNQELHGQIERLNKEKQELTEKYQYDLKEQEKKAEEQDADFRRRLQEAEQAKSSLSEQLQKLEAEVKAEAEKPVSNEELEATRRKVVELQEELAKEKQNVAKATSQVPANSRDELSKLQRQMENLQAALMQERQNLAMAEAEKTRMYEEQKRAAELRELQLSAARREQERIAKIQSQQMAAARNEQRILEERIAELSKIQQDYLEATRQLAERDKTLESKTGEIRQKDERLATLESSLLAKSDEINSAGVTVQSLKRKLAESEALQQRLQEELTAARRRLNEQDKQWTDLQTEVRGQEKQKVARDQQVLELQNALKARSELIAKLEEGARQSEGKVKDAETALQQTRRELQEARDSLKRLEDQSQAANGLTANMVEAQKNLADLQKEMDKVQAERQSLLERVKLLEEMQNKTQASTTAEDDKVWLGRLAKLNEKLQSEEKRRQALEVALINLQNQSPSTTVSTTDKAADEKSGSGPDGDSQFALRQEVIINGFLRQGVDAEKNKRLEAALWNYEKVLELDPDNGIALKRLGLMAANRGDDAKTAQYLRKAFRFDTDDTELLLALGFSMINLDQPYWALADLGRAVALQPQNPVIARLFGVALVRMGWRQAAEKQFLQAYELNKKDPEVAFNLAVLCLTDTPARKAEAAKWYGLAVANGAEKDPRLEQALK